MWACRVAQMLAVLSYADLFDVALMRPASVFTVGSWPSAFRGGFEFLHFYVAPLLFYPSFFEVFNGECSGALILPEDRLVR